MLSNRLMGSSSSASQFIAVGHNGTPGISVYPWSSAGFGTKYTSPVNSMTQTYDLAFSAAGDVIIAGHTQASNPFSSGLSAYRWSSAGFGTKFSEPSVLPGNEPNGTFIYSVSFSPAEDAIAIGMFASDDPAITAGRSAIEVYAWSNLGFGAKFSNPTILPIGIGISIAFSPAGDAIAVCHVGNPDGISVYRWSGAGFGTRFTNPATFGAGSSAVVFSPAGDAIVTDGGGSNIEAYGWSSSGFGTKFLDPATPASQSGIDGGKITFSPSGSTVASAHTNPGFSIYPWSVTSGFGIKYANPTNIGTGEGIAFSPNEDAIAIATNTTPFIVAYAWSPAGVGTRFSDPASLPLLSGKSVAFGEIK